MTNEAKHTPGPWYADRWRIYAKVGKTTNGIIALVKYPNDVSCYPMMDGSKNKYIRERESNAYLIAAAPELYKYLKTMLAITCGECKGEEGKCMSGEIDVCFVAREAKEVLARAEGKNSDDPGR